MGAGRTFFILFPEDREWKVHSILFSRIYFGLFLEIPLNNGDGLSPNQVEAKIDLPDCLIGGSYLYYISHIKKMVCLSHITDYMMTSFVEGEGIT